MVDDEESRGPPRKVQAMLRIKMTRVSLRQARISKLCIVHTQNCPAPKVSLFVSKKQSAEPLCLSRRRNEGRWHTATGSWESFKGCDYGVGRLKNCKICLLLIASSASVTRLCSYRAPVHWPTLPQDRSDEETRTCPRCIAA